MSLSDRINSDLREAMLKKDANKTSSLRMLKAAVMNLEISKKDFTDADVNALIQKQIKQRKDSIEQYQKGGRADLAKKEEAEIAVYEAYLPKQVDDAQLEKTVRDALSGSGVSSKKDFGKAMKLVQEKLKGSADNKRVSELLGRILQ